jgi:predicted transposase/invertase (TIGR01784 family)
METYEKILAEYNDVRLMMEYSHDKGFEAGIERGITQIANEMQKSGFSSEQIMQLTGLSLEQIRQIK